MIRQRLLPLALAGLFTASALACDGPTQTQDPEPDPVAAEPEAAAPEWPDEPFRAERPTPKPIKDVQIPSIETFELDNGVEVYLVRQQTLPTVLMYFEWDLGEVDDPRGKTGTASVCADLLAEATATKDKASFKAAQSDHGVDLNLFSSNEITALSVRALRKELPAALDLAAEMLMKPGLREDVLTRLLDQEKARLEQRKGSASSIAYRLFPSLVWGSKHKYGKLETSESIDEIQLSDCARWAKKLRPEGARLWVVGKISPDEVKAEIGERFGGWKGKAPRRAKVAAAKPAKGTLFFVDVPGSAQSQILIGHPGPTRDAEDYAATQLMAAILGGSFSSRINMNLREDKGWAYGARGNFSYRRGGSYFTAGSSVRSDATGDAVRELFEEIDRMRTSDPSQDEVSREQQGALLGMPADFATATRTMFSFRSLTYFDLPLDWYQGHQEQLRAVDIPAIRAAAEAHLQARDHVVLVAGDGRTVLESLEAIASEELFGAGGIQYLDTDGNPMARPTYDDAPAG